MPEMPPALHDICNQHLEYTKWADNLLLTAIQTNIPGRAEILEHIFMAERIWLARILDNVQPSHFHPPAGPAALAEEWAELHRQWLGMAAAETEWDRVVTFKLRNGTDSSSPLWHIVLHVANHGTYHRGQAAAALRAAGYTPPGTDLILWYRLQAGYQVI